MPTLFQPAPAKCAALVEFIRGEIERCNLLPGDRLPTIAELKKRFGFSNSTIAQGYFLLEQEGLVRRSQGTGVFVADRPVVQLQGVIGVMIPAELQRHAYYSRLMSGVGQVARKEGVELLLFHESSNIRWEKVDGVILSSPSLVERRRLPQGMPAVSLLHALDGTPSVVTNDAQIMHEIVDHLLALGHRRIGIIIGIISVGTPGTGVVLAENRLDGYRRAMRASGIEPLDSWIRPMFQFNDYSGKLMDDREIGRMAMRRWLQEGWDRLNCTALIAQNDGTAVGVIDILTQAQVRVPEDVSVVGFDGLEIAEYFHPRLTTAAVPLEEIGACGAEILLEQVRSPLDSNIGAASDVVAGRVVIPSRLKVGESTASVFE